MRTGFSGNDLNSCFMETSLPPPPIWSPTRGTAHLSIFPGESCKSHPLPLECFPSAILALALSPLS